MYKGTSTSLSKPSQAQLFSTEACQLSAKSSTSLCYCINKVTSIFLNIGTSHQILFQQGSTQQQKDSCHLCCEKAHPEKNYGLVSGTVGVHSTHFLLSNPALSGSVRISLSTLLCTSKKGFRFGGAVCCKIRL